jgi:hypothetical protein
MSSAVNAVAFAAKHKNKFNINGKGGRLKETCLHLAAGFGSTEILHTLQTAHANPFLPNILNKSARQAAMY